MLPTPLGVIIFILILYGAHASSNCATTIYVSGSDNGPHMGIYNMREEEGRNDSENPVLF